MCAHVGNPSTSNGLHGVMGWNAAEQLPVEIDESEPEEFKPFSLSYVTQH